MDESTKRRWDAECERVAGEVERINREILDLEDSIDGDLPDDRRPNAAVAIMLTLALETAARSGMSPYHLIDRLRYEIARATLKPWPDPPPMSLHEFIVAIRRTRVPEGVDSTYENQLVQFIVDACAVVVPTGGVPKSDASPDPRHAGVILARAQTVAENGEGQATVVVSPTGQETKIAICHHPNGRVAPVQCSPLGGPPTARPDLN